MATTTKPEPKWQEGAPDTAHKQTHRSVKHKRRINQQGVKQKSRRRHQQGREAEKEKRTNLQPGAKLKYGLSILSFALGCNGSRPASGCGIPGRHFQPVAPPTVDVMRGSAIPYYEHASIPNGHICRDECAPRTQASRPLRESSAKAGNALINAQTVGGPAHTRRRRGRASRCGAFRVYGIGDVAIFLRPR